MGNPMFWADELDWLDLICSQNYHFLEMESMSLEQSQNFNNPMKLQEKKSDQSFNSDSPASDTPDAMPTYVYVHNNTMSPPQIIEETPSSFYFSSSDESVFTDPSTSEPQSDVEYLNGGGMCSHCNVRVADTCIVHQQGRHLDVCITCAAHCFKFHMPCPLCELPMLYIYRYDNI